MQLARLLCWGCDLARYVCTVCTSYLEQALFAEEDGTYQNLVLAAEVGCGGERKIEQAALICVDKDC